MKWTLQQIAEWTQGQTLSEVTKSFEQIGTDTRQDLTGKLFVALKGDQFDAHNYLEQAVEKGAAGILVHEFPEKLHHLKSKTSVILVQDTLKALQDMAHGYRKTLKTKIIGITGSNGKTTTKEFTAAILSQFKKTHFNQGSFNNHWGVPMTLLEIPQDAAFAVVEMGMNNYGEIALLVKIAEPDIVVCTMVGRAHIEFFGTEANIAKAKFEIYDHSQENTVRIFNQDQDLTFDMMYPIAKKFPASRMLTFSEKNNEADVFLKIVEISMRGIKVSGIIGGVKGEAEVPVFGKQNITNIMASACIAHACGMPAEKIWAGLTQLKTTWGRNQFIENEYQAEILFDGYNANPDSMKALLENLPLIKNSGQRIGVFGQMKELGAAATDEHFNLGELAGGSGFSTIFFVGENFADFVRGLKSSGYSGKHYINAEFSDFMGQQLAADLKKGDLVVLKGSRGAKIERFLDFCKPLNWSPKK